MLTSGMIAAIILSAAVGLSLGLIGGGGSIITVPLLVYVAGVSPADSITMSLAIVGATSLLGSVIKWRQGLVHVRALEIYALTGVFGAQFGAPLTRLVPGAVLLILFALIMIAVAARMVQTRQAGDGTAGGDCRVLRCALTGLGVGVLTGFLGVGGGFLIVPALTSFARLPMRMAVGTSLPIIALNSMSGFLGHLASGFPHPYMVLGFTVAALAGMAFGLSLSGRVQASALRSGFAGLSFAVAIFLLVKNGAEVARVYLSRS